MKVPQKASKDSLVKYEGDTRIEPNPQHTSIINSLPEVDPDELMPPISKWTQVSGLLMVASIVATIFVAALTPYKVIVKAPVTIRPDTKIKLVEARTTGTVVTIQAQENQYIEAGEIIATIDNLEIETEQKLLENKIQQAQLQLQQIQAQTDSLNRQILAEKNRIQDSITEADYKLSLSLREYQNLQITTVAQVAEAEANLKVTEEELKQAIAELKSAQATLDSRIAELKSVQAKRDRYKSVAESGALSQDRLEEVQLAFAQQKQNVLAQTAVVERQEIAVSRQQQNVAGARAKLDQVRAALNPSNATVAIAQQRIKELKDSGDATLAALKREQEVLKQKSIDLSSQLTRDAQQLQQVKQKSDRNMIKAPASGILFQLNLNNPGQIVQSGTEIAQIVPDNAALIAKTLVDAQDINKVITGQQARLKISACPYPDYGTAKGFVTQVSPDTIRPQVNSYSLDSQNNSQATTPSFYEVIIQLKSLNLNQGNKKCVLKLGMEGTADIITKEESILQFFLRKIRLMSDL